MALAAAGSATAMMDVSDSLALDSSRLAKASGVSLEISSSALFGYQAVLELAAQSINSRGPNDVNELEWVLFGGEDHSFLTTFPADLALPRGFKAIGKVVAQGESAVLFDGKPLEARGWDSVSS
jgi:thiamine-monophosphate kinase